MHFIYPGFLWALFVVFIPIIIHLFTFRRYKTVYFSNVAFLQNIQKESKSKSKLKNLLLLLLRVLAIVFLVLVFAKPVITKDSDVVISKQSLVGVYIDNSFSMEASGKYGKLLEFAKMKAVEIADNHDLNTLFLLSTNDFELKHHKFVNKDQFIDWVSQIKPSHINRKFDQVYEHQNHLFKKIDSIISIKQYVFSDFQKSAFNTEYLPTNSHVQTIFVPLLHQNISNVFVDSVWFESPGHYLSKQEVLKVKVTNFSDQEVIDLQVNLFVNDSLKAISNQSFLPNESKILDMQFVQTKAGWSKAKIELADYPITFDNTLFFSFFIDKEIPMLEITESDINSYVGALFADDKRFAFKSTIQNGSFYSEFSNYKVIIINQLKELSSGLISALREANVEGCRLIIIPPVDMPQSQYNKLLKALGAPVLGEWRTEKGQMQGLDFNHTYFKKSIKPGGENIRLPDYNGYYSTFVSSNFNYEIILETESENPLVIKGSSAQGDFILLTIPLNAEYTNLATHPLFVPLFYNSALYSVRFNDLFYALQPNLVVKTKLNSNVNIELFDSVNNIRQMPRAITSSGYTSLFLSESDLSAGHSDIMEAETTNGVLSFNYNRIESLMEFFSEKELISFVETSNIGNMKVLKTDAVSLNNEIQKQADGRTLSQLFLWLLVLALVSEVLLIRLFK